MKGLSELIDSLEIKFFKLNKKLVGLEKHNEELQLKLKETEEKLALKSEEFAVLNEKIDNLKMINSLLGSEENKRETKLKINSLIREIDFCIAQLSD